jgi:aminopeptidase N
MAMPPADAPRPTYRRDYHPPTYTIPTVDLAFTLGDAETLVTAELHLVRRPGVGPGPLRLDGEGLDLRAITIDGVTPPASAWRIEDGDLVLTDPPADVRLRTTVAIRPQDNTELSGLYRTGGLYCTQCEAEGFRRITFFLDRPDVMCRFRTRIDGDAATFPVLLSNGNRLATGPLPGGRHFVQWEDPFPKPCYLFALVAGRLTCVPGSFTTASGRQVRLEIWVEPGNEDRCAHALASLQAAMRWDEDRYGREYDLDLFMLVAVSDFNMGAMENKGLNIFNAKYVLARPDTATDDDYEAIAAVIAHEYFHNWTGDRVTCRDWFQLTLKEGLTVFRDSQFTADTTSAAVKRIDDVRTLRIVQFPEDAGPLRHPIRPESYVVMDNFYTATVYEKGAEVVGLYHTLLGRDGFRRGMDLYFQRHDGQAVTCDDFRAAMADANGRDLTRMEEWYRQPGTPRLTVHGRHHPSTGRYTLRLTQRNPAVPDAPPLPIPVAVGLLGPDGRDLLPEGTRRLEFTDREQEFTFEGIAVRPILSVLRGFSAPVIVECDRRPAELAFLMAQDPDPVNRWDAGQELMRRALLAGTAALVAGRRPVWSRSLVEAWGRTLTDPSIDDAFRALALIPPTERELAQQVETVDPAALHRARESLLDRLVRGHREALRSTYHRCVAATGGRQEAVNARRCRNTVLGLLGRTRDPADLRLARAQYDAQQDMTLVAGALAVLAAEDNPHREAVLADFLTRWQGDPLVLDKWFTIQATARGADTLDRVLALRQHPAFTLANPNRVRSLIGAFCGGNHAGFHAADGRGYAFLRETVLELDAKNPQIAARMAGLFNQWRRFEPGRRGRMRRELESIRSHAGLSRDTAEIVGKALGNETD